MNVFQSVGCLVASFADPPADRKFDLDLGLKDQTKDIQDRHYKVVIYHTLGYVICVTSVIIRYDTLGYVICLTSVMIRYDMKGIDMIFN